MYKVHIPLLLPFANLVKKSFESYKFTANKLKIIKQKTLETRSHEREQGAQEKFGGGLLDHFRSLRRFKDCSIFFGFVVQ